MFCWRITKYNPKYRNNKGAYLKNEWTCFSDIGQEFEGNRLTIEEYETVEALYIKAILSFMECLNIHELQIFELEKFNTIDEFLIDIEENKKIQEQLLPEVVRLILRNMIWCKLESSNMYVHFGHDYYMYIGSNKSCNSAIEKIKKSGLFVEKYESPYE